jgi:hypothetical protein
MASRCVIKILEALHTIDEIFKEFPLRFASQSHLQHSLFYPAKMQNALPPPPPGAQVQETVEETLIQMSDVIVGDPILSTCFTIR